MPRYDRTNMLDAQRAVERLLPHAGKRQKFIDVLCDAIALADGVDPANWNLNLDPAGAFLRFNTGHEYCIQLDRRTLLVLCDKVALRQLEDVGELPVTYKGWHKDRFLHDRHFDNVPEILQKTRNSVGCCIDISGDFVGYIDRLRPANHSFIQAAMRTRLLTQSRAAHSPGAVEYVFANFGEQEA